MKKIARITSINAVAVLALCCASSASGQITLTNLSTAFNNAVGIDYHQPTNKVVVSQFYPSGSPNNFALIDSNGAKSSFSAISGLTDEVKIATVRAGNAGGFTTGDLFTGNGVNGQVVRISADGSTAALFANLGAGAGLMRGSLFVDRYGVVGGDLLAATTTGEVWRINSSGAGTKLADLNGVHLEGLQTIPNLPSVYGGLAGKIIAGAEGQGLLYVFDPTPNAAYTSYNLGVNIEDIDMINANENFYGVNYSQGRILGAAAANFSSMVGEILLTQEFPNSGGSGLYRMKWDFFLNRPVATQITLSALNGGITNVTQWEHVTFAPAGIVEIPSTAVPDAGSTMLLLGATIAGLVGMTRSRKV